MRKMVIVLALLLTWAGVAEAQVVLPASGRLAGPLEPTQSQLGDEFFNFPDFLGQRPLPGESPLSGHLEFAFGEPFVDADGFNKVFFDFTYHGVGTTDTWSFENGQAYLLAGNTAFENPALPNQGLLNLDTGAIEHVVVHPIWRNSTIAEVNKYNRMPFGFPPSFPAALPPPELVEAILGPGVDFFEFLDLPPGSVFNSAAFTYDKNGRITGFQFFGLTIVPAGIFGPINNFLHAVDPASAAFPPFCFGPHGEFYFAHPYDCLYDDTFCSDPTSSPDGMMLAPRAFFRPYFILGSHELQEVETLRQVPPCAPAPGADAVVVGAANKLYVLGGVDADGLTSGRMRIYDPMSGAFSEGPHMPVAVTEAQGAVFGTKIYVYGGRKHLEGPARDLLQIFDLASGTWMSGPEGPVAIARGVAAFAGDKLYVLGGRTNRANGSPAGNLRFNTRALRFDPASGLWSPFPMLIDEGGTMAKIHFERASAVTVGSNIYVLGGKTRAGEVLDRVLVLPGVNERFRAGPRMCFGLDGCRSVYDAAAAVVGNRIYLIGGREEAYGPATAGVRVLTVGRDTWMRLPEAPFPVAGTHAAALHGEVYVAGGYFPSESKSDVDPGSVSPPDSPRGDSVTPPDSPRGDSVTAAVQAYDPGRGWTVCGSEPLFTADGVMSSASLALPPRELSPGSLAVIVGHNFGGPARAPADKPVPTELAGLRVIVDGLPAPILAVEPHRLDFQVPNDVLPGSAEVVVERADLTRQAPAVRVPVAQTAPGLFVETFGETRDPIYLDAAAAIACNGDGTLNYAANPVAPGTAITLHATGLGAVPEPIKNGPGGPDALLIEAPVTVTIGGLEAAVVAGVLAEGGSGLCAITVIVPESTPMSNRVPVEIAVMGKASNRGVIAVGLPETVAPLPCDVTLPFAGP